MLDEISNRASDPSGPTGDVSVPLVVDLDGTLLNSDLLIETAFAELGRRPFALPGMFAALAKGKAVLKRLLASESGLDVTTLPYNESVLNLVGEARKSGRQVFLASASDAELVDRIASHLNLFDGTFASDGVTNLAGPAKASVLVQRFGEKGFDYVGNDKADFPVWKVARKCHAVRCSKSVEKELASIAGDYDLLDPSAPSPRAWLRLLRVHQYTKNLLVFVPLITAHRFDAEALILTTLAVLAFSLCASAVYLLNDLVDLGADRAHPTKRERPLAKGDIPLFHALVAIPLLLLAAFGLAFVTSWQFVGVLALYLTVTTAYSFSLKRKMLVDVVTLACLYTLRVIGGAAAIQVAVSEWLLAFSIFVFFSLALLKRYAELTERLDREMKNPSNRNYQIGDLPVVAALAAAAAMNAVTVFALYISSDAVKVLYSKPYWLWLICPTLMYWMARALMMAHRRHMPDDPIVFAIKDNVSRLTAVVVLVLVILAT